MLRIRETRLVPLFDGNFAPQMVADEGKAAYVNYLTVKPKDKTETAYSHTAARIAAFAVAETPTERLFNQLAKQTPELRARRAFRAQANLEFQLERAVDLDATSPTAPLLLREDRSNYVFTSDGFLILGVRGNGNLADVGMIGPTGTGAAGLSITGRPLSRHEDAARILQDQFGLRTSHFYDLGINPVANKLRGEVLVAEDSDQWAVGVLPTISYAACTQLAKPLRSVLPKIQLTHNHVGVAVLSPSDLQQLTSGEGARILFVPSKADAANEVVKSAIIEGLGRNLTYRGQSNIPSEKPLNLGSLRWALTEPGAPRIPKVESAGTPARYFLGENTYPLSVSRTDFQVANRDILAEAVLASAQAGFHLADDAVVYGAQHAHMKPAPAASLLGETRRLTRGNRSPSIN